MTFITYPVESYQTEKGFILQAIYFQDKEVIKIEFKNLSLDRWKKQINQTLV